MNVELSNGVPVGRWQGTTLVGDVKQYRNATNSIIVKPTKRKLPLRLLEEYGGFVKSVEKKGYLVMDSVVPLDTPEGALYAQTHAKELSAFLIHSTTNLAALQYVYLDFKASNLGHKNNRFFIFDHDAVHRATEESTDKGFVMTPLLFCTSHLEGDKALLRTAWMKHNAALAFLGIMSPPFYEKVFKPTGGGVIHMVPSITTFNNRYLTKLCNKYLDEAYALMDPSLVDLIAPLYNTATADALRALGTAVECNFIDYTQDRSVRL